METQVFTCMQVLPLTIDNDAAMDTDVEMVDREEQTHRLRLQLAATEHKFRRACEQIVLLNYKLSGMQARYDNAKQRNLRTFRYTYRLQLAVIEGAKNVYHDYAVTQAERMRSLQMEIFGEIPDHSDGDDGDMEEVDQV